MKILQFLLVIVGVCTTRGDYIGAVVELNSLSGADPSTTVEQNTERYIVQIEQAKILSVEIIVFPEYGLTGLVEDPEEYAIDIPQVGTSNFSTDAAFSVLQRLSNAALEHSMYVVVNLLEKETIDNSTLYYNTNIVFANNGTLIAKYRKINLYNEDKLTAGTNLTTFTTLFGTFGLFTCMDILYYHPAQSILKDTGVDNIIFPTAWTSVTPFYMSLEVQLGYAIANKVNLLAANLNNPTEAIGGSSIVSKDGVLLRKVLTDKPQTLQIFATLQTTSTSLNNFVSRGFDFLENEPRADLSNYKNITNFDYGAYTFKKLDLSVENITNEQVCHSDFCCNFNILAYQNQTNTSEVYQLVAFSGLTKFDTQDVNIKFCALVACLSDNIVSCGLRPSYAYNTVFQQIAIWNEWESHPEEFYRPISLRGNLDSIYNATYLETVTADTVSVSHNITVPQDNIVLFGVFVRSGAASVTGVSLLFLAVLVMVQALF